MLILLPCLQCREMQQTRHLKKHQRFKLTVWVYSGFGILLDFTIFRVVDKMKPNEAKMLLR